MVEFGSDSLTQDNPPWLRALKPSIARERQREIEKDGKRKKKRKEEKESFIVQETVSSARRDEKLHRSFSSCVLSRLD